MSICSKCKRELPESAFSKPYIDKKGRTYKRSYCKECNRLHCKEYDQKNKQGRNERLRKWRKKNPIKAHDADRRKNLQRNYGLSTSQYQDLKEECKGKCSLCGMYTPTLELDHNHKTKRIRGFLCRKCNLLLGLIEDRSLSLEQIGIYLDKPCHADILLEFLNELKEGKQP